MTQTELLEMLEKHRKWLEGKDGGERVNLYEANLRGVDLRGVNMRGADLRGADLRTNLSYADLRGAELSYANMRGANLRGVEMSHANLCGADMSYADLREAEMSHADLSYVNLRGANLREAKLCGADLYKCTLPLWCGGLHIILDRVQMAQLIYHFCSMECEDLEVLELQKSMYAFANEFVESRYDLQLQKFPEEVISNEQSTQTV